MPSLFHGLGKEHQQARHQSKDGQHAEQNGFDENDSHVKPIWNCINIMAARPEMVVRLLAEMEGMEALTAAMQASRSPAYSRSSRKRWSMMMA